MGYERTKSSELPTPTTQGTTPALAPPKPQYEYKQPVFIGDSLRDRSFRLEILSAKQEDASKLRFEILVRSQCKGIARMTLNQPAKTAYVVDTEGNRYGFLTQENLTGDFPGGVDVRGSMTFLAPTPTVKRINVVFQYKVGMGYPCAVIFRNLDLNLMKLVEPVEDESRTKEPNRRAYPRR